VMFVIFLGTGNALPSIDRANTMLALLAHPDDPAVLIDCGGDPYRALCRSGLNAERISDIIITHAHIDHIGGLPSLIESFRIAGRTTPLHIYGLPQVLETAKALFQAFAFELTLDCWPFSIELHEWQAEQTHQIGVFTVTTMVTEHSVPSVGLRVACRDVANSPIFGYTSDTVAIPALHEIAQGADFFVAEATYSQGMEEDARHVHHMTAQQAAEIAANGQATTLGLVHLSVSHEEERAVIQEAHQSFKRTIIVPHDQDIYLVDHARTRRIRRLLGATLRKQDASRHWKNLVPSARVAGI
jgi:ribonuclease Z